MDKIENEYGTLFLSEKRAKEYIDIVDKHILSLLLELKEHKIIPNYIKLEKTSVYEYDYFNQQEQG